MKLLENGFYSDIDQQKVKDIIIFSSQIKQTFIKNDPFFNNYLIIGEPIKTKCALNSDSVVDILILMESEDQLSEIQTKTNRILGKLTPRYSLNCIFCLDLSKIEDLQRIKNNMVRTGTIKYFRLKYVTKFIATYPILPEVFKIIRKWNLERKLEIPTIILEIIVIESIFRITAIELSTNTLLKSAFRTLHNTLEGISVIPRNWFDFSLITANVSPLGNKLVDPGDPSNNLLMDIDYQLDKQIRDEALRAISLLEDIE